MKVIWTALALKQIENAHAYIAAKNEAAAVRIILRILNTIELLTKNPELGRKADQRGVRDLIVADTRYIVPYRIVDDEIVLLAVLHHAQKRPKL